MRILGIETSCDETAAAVVETTGDAARPWAVLSSVIASQADIHREWGGVVPEIASRQHVADICGVVEGAMAEAGLDPSNIDAVAVTQGPGLVGSLLVGVSFAKAFAAARSLPVIAVNHLAGHIESLVLEHGELPLPAVVLVVSGGHTSLYFIPQPGSIALSGRRETMPPARRTTRSQSCSDSAIRAAQTWIAWPPRVAMTRWPCRCHDSRTRTATRPLPI